MPKPKLLYIDLFCGAGGTSTGVERARHNGEQCAKVIACVNHDANAIASHAANHPDALHFTEDIRTLELSPITTHIERMKRQYPDAMVVLWASLECTNFSRAKGGMPRDADSRTLAEHLFRYIDAIDPEYIQIENVEEFMSWGDLDDNGKPISRDAGRCYRQWVDNVKACGYEFEYRILNSADYGAYTSRKRFFGIFARTGLPIVWPKPTHAKNPTKTLFDNMEQWKAVKDTLELHNEGNSIFGRKKPIVDKSLERIYAGLIKFVAGGKDNFLIKYNSMNQSGKYKAPNIDEPSPVVSTQGRLGVAKVHFLSKYFSGNPRGKNVSLDSVAGAITTTDHHSVVATKFIASYYGAAPQTSSLDKPAPTLTTKDRLSYVSARFIDMQYGNGQAVSIDTPACTVTNNPKHSLVVCKPWIMNTSFSNVGASVEVPCQTITANRKWHYLVNPQYTSAGGSVNTPCFTLIARMDKMPPSVATVVTDQDALSSFIRHEGNALIYEIYSTDTEPMVRIKEFMALYGIIDIKIRMLLELELKRIMGFGDDYILIGTQAERKKYIGNAVEVTMARVLCEALCAKLIEENITPHIAA